MTIPRTPAVLMAAATMTLALGACGSTGKGDGSGRPDDAKALAFARCMRAAGIDIADPSTDGKARRIDVPKGIAPQRLAAIQARCAKQTGGAPKPPSPEQQAKLLDRALKFSRCMRAHGVDLPDPKPGPQGGAILRQRSGASIPDPSSPAFRQAQKACAALVPAAAQLNTSKGPGE